MCVCITQGNRQEEINDLLCEPIPHSVHDVKDVMNPLLCFVLMLSGANSLVSRVVDAPSVCEHVWECLVYHSLHTNCIYVLSNMQIAFGCLQKL